MIPEKESNNGKQHLRFKIIQRKKGILDAISDIIDHVALLQSIYSIENVNNYVSIFVKWIFDSNYKKALLLLVE